jgi:hypothetical protein
MSEQLQGKRIAILVASERVELTEPRDALREAGAEIVEEFAEGVHEGQREAMISA